MNFSSLNDIRKKEEEESKRNEYYSGGNDNRGGGSGLNIVAPNSSDPFQRIVDSASQNSQGMPAEHAEGTKRKITLYKNGFTVDDGPFRDAESPENKKFIQSLVAGFIPPELQADVPRNADGRPAEVFIGLEDRRGENYRAPTPPAYVAYSGEGSSIGGTAPTNVLSPSIFATDAPPPVDESLPTTLLQIKLHNGKKLKLKMNHHHTVRHLIGRIFVSDGVPSQNFTLSAGFPPKEISDVEATLADAGLVGAAITQKFV